MKSKIKALIKEKDGIRGLVPSRSYGSLDVAYSTYLNSLNPRENEDLQIALASSPDPRFNMFLDRVTKKGYKRIGLATIAKECNIGMMEFNDWWSRASTQRSIALAQTGSVAITRDLVDDARSIITVCERCDGLGWIGADAGLPKGTPGYRSMQSGADTLWIRDCPNCESGKVRRPGDAHARDKVLEMSGLTKKGNGITINQSFGGASHASAISCLDEAMTIDI